MIVLVIMWTCVGVFISTAIITLLGLVNIIKIEKKYMNALFTALILEVTAIGGGIFSGTIDPSHIVQMARDTGEQEAYKRLEKEISTSLDEVTKGMKQRDYQHSSIHLKHVFDDILFDKVSILAKAFYLKGLLAEKRMLWNEAAHSYETSLQIKPNDAKTLARAGRTKSKLKDYEKAREYYLNAQQNARNIGDNDLEYSIANGLQNVERRFGAFLIEVGRKESADYHFSRALIIVRSMKSIRPNGRSEALEKKARYRIFWEWKKYDEAIAEISSLMEKNENIEYKEDLCAILVESGGQNVKKAYIILKKLFTNNEISNYSISTLAEAAALLETNLEFKKQILNQLNRSIVMDDPENRDPYLYYVKAKLLNSLGNTSPAISSLDEAIRLEKYRSRNIYIFDPTRLDLYQTKRLEWKNAIKLNKNQS